MEQRRTAAGLAGHAEFTLEYESDVLTDRGIDWLADGLAESIREGSRYPVGEAVGIGWLDCYVIDRGDGTLGLCEPDFAQLPVTLVPGTSKALEQVWFQIEIARSVGLEPELDFPNYLQQARTCDAFAGSESVLLHRYPHADTESGWFIGCPGTAHRHTEATLRSATLYELALLRPVIVGYLALPANCSIVLGTGIPEIIRHNERLTFGPESLLGRMFGRPGDHGLG